MAKNFQKFLFEDGGHVKTRVIRSFIWVGASEVSFAVVNFVRSIALARLLTPSMFGLVGLAGIALRAIETATRPGIGQALIAREGKFELARDTAFTMLVARGVVLAVLLFVSAPWVTAFYGEAELHSILQVLSLTFLIGGFSNINLIARQKELDFRRLTYFYQGTLLAGTFITILAAFLLRNVWALVIGQVASALIGTIMSYWFVDGRPRFAWNWRIARELVTYGKFVTGSSIVVFIASELDSVVIGKWLGPEALGFYILAFTIVHLVTSNISKVASSILMPAYSKLQRDPVAIRSAYLRTLSLVMFAVLPAAAGLAIVAEPMTLVVYGEQWLPAARPMQLLAIAGLLRAVCGLSGYLFEGIGRPKVAFWLGLLRLAVVAPLIVPMVWWFGLEGAAVTISAGLFVQALASAVYLRRAVGVGIVDSMRVIQQPLWTTLVMCLGIVVFASLTDLGDLAELLVVVPGGVVVYCALNWSVLVQLRRETRDLG